MVHKNALAQHWCVLVIPADVQRFAEALQSELGTASSESSGDKEEEKNKEASQEKDQDSAPS